MNCNCNKVNSVPPGATSINLGVYMANAPVNVLFKTATGRLDVVAVTCDSSGNIIIPMPSLRSETPYEVSISAQSDETQTPLLWTIESTQVSCISLEFRSQYQNDTAFGPATFEITVKA